MTHISLAEYVKSRSTPLREATVSFLVKDGHVLLAMKKRGFGEGKWNGVGGKQNPDETIEQTAIRETMEEIGVRVTSQKKRAVLNFYFHDKREWGQRVSAFLVDSWDGDPVETEEMNPDWFALEDIPFPLMWADGQHWIPLVLMQGKYVKGDFLFNKRGQLLEFAVFDVKADDLQ